jgi:DNA recombination protein RmuC
MGTAAVALLLVAILLLVALLRRPAPESVRAELRHVDESVARESERIGRLLREEMGRDRAEHAVALDRHAEATSHRLKECSERHETVLASFGHRLSQFETALDIRFEGLRTTVDTKLASIQEDGSRTLEDMRGAHATALTSFGLRLAGFETTLDARFEGLRTTVDTKLASIQEDNSRKLDQMRGTVEEKLQTTLERRVGESFALVSTQLEQVHRGLGEMRVLSEDVGDLRRVMSNVRARGALGEWRLEALLEQMMAPDQYSKNVRPIPDSGATVEFAIRLPQHGDPASVTWLPVDSKFPMEDYERVIAAQDTCDKETLDDARRGLARAVKKAACDINQKYIAPPHTTDFGILFLPTEGLFAEVVRHPCLVEEIQRDYRVMLAGPTTLATLLNCLQMGFRTVALAERSKEVWHLLGAVRTEYGKFADTMATVKKKIEQAHSAVESVETRTRAMGRKLRAVDALPAGEADRLLDEEATETESYDREVAIAVSSL